MSSVHAFSVAKEKHVPIWCTKDKALILLDPQTGEEIHKYVAVIRVDCF